MLKAPNRSHAEPLPQRPSCRRHEPGARPRLARRADDPSITGGSNASRTWHRLTNLESADKLLAEVETTVRAASSEVAFPSHPFAGEGGGGAPRSHCEVIT